MAETMWEGLAGAQTLDAFHDLCVAHGVHGPARRFMHLELDITNRCNLRCVMCYHSYESTRRTRTVHMTPDEFSLIASRVLPNAYHLSLSLGNEPLMSPHFIPILRVAATHAVPNINFFTNGQLLTDAKIDAIIECGVTQVCVSIDGATPAIYNAIRRNGDFDVVVRNVARLVARRNAAGSSTPRVRFDFVMMQRNVHELVELVRLASRLGVQELSLFHLVRFEDLDMERESLTHTKALSNYWLERGLATAAELEILVQGHPAPFDLGDPPAPAAEATGTPFLPTPYCPFPFFHVSVGPGGHVLPCPYSHGEAPYGEVSPDVPFETVWLGPKFTTLRERILRHDPPPMCRRCPFLANRYPDTAALFAVRKQ